MRRFLRRVMSLFTHRRDETSRSFVWLDDLQRDLRHAVRGLGRTPGVTTSIALTLALGIGAATTVCSIAYGVLLRPLPYPSPDRLVRVWEEVPGGTMIASGNLWLSSLTADAWRGRSRTVVALGTYASRNVTVDLGTPTRVAAGIVSPSVFDVLRVSPALGRLFVADDARPGAPPAVVLSAGLWRDQFGGQASALGQSLLIDQVPHLIVGVAPQGFAFPASDARLWIVGTRPPPRNGVPQVSADSSIARLAADASLQQAEDEGTSIARAQPRLPIMDVLWGKGGPVQVRMRPFVADMTARVQPAVLLVVAAVACLLLLGCANVANLLLARSVSREREVAMRTALGAGRGRLVRQLLTESAVMSSIGGVIGVAVAFLLVRALPALVPRRFPRVDDVHIDAPMLAVACGLTLMSAVLSGVAPMLRSVRVGVLSSLREGAGSTPGRRAGWIRQMLLTGEAALAVMLLVVALLVGRSLTALLRVDAGYDAGNVVTARVYLPGAGRAQAETDVFVPQLLERVRAVPGVVAAGAGGMAPFSDLTMATPVTVPVTGRTPVTAVARVYVITPGYAETLRLQLRAGRFFTQADLASGVQTMVVNEAFVNTFLHGVPPIGFMTNGVLTRGVRAEVVGVVGDVLKDGPRTRPLPEVYIVPAHRYSLRSEIHLLARTSGHPEGLMQALQGLVQHLRADASIDTVTTLEAQTSESVGTERLATATLTGLAVFAVLLSAVGLYGVLSQVIASRTRELGVRTALGATRGRIARLVIGDGMRTTGVGLLLGLVAAAGVSRFMGAMLFGIAPLDPISYGVAGLVLALVALVACGLPARRAARVDPIEALRAS